MKKTFKVSARKYFTFSIPTIIFFIVSAMLLGPIFPAAGQNQKAERFYEQGRYNEAVNILKKDFFKNDDLASGILLAHAYYRLREYEEALDVLDLVNPERMTESKDIRFYADVQIANDDFSGAYLTLIRLLSASETDAEAYIWLEKTADLVAWDSLRTLSEVNSIRGLNSFANEYAPFLAPDDEIWYVADQNSLQVVFPAAFTNQNIHLFYETAIAKRDTLTVRTPAMLMKKREYYYHDGPMAKWPGTEKYALTLREIDGLQYDLKVGIFFTKLTGDEEDIIPFEYNKGADTGHPTFTEDGSRMYFASDREGGYGQMDIWYSDHVNGEWTEPVNLGPQVNTAGTEAFPLVHEYRLFYSSDRRDIGYGGMDLYYVSLLNESHRPYNLRQPLNSAYDDFAMTFRSHERGYFSSNRLDGAGGDDIYDFRFVPEQLVIDTLEFKIMPLRDADIALMVYDADGMKVAEVHPDEYGIVSVPGLTTGEVYYIDHGGSADVTIYRVDEEGKEIALSAESEQGLPVELISDQNYAFVRKDGQKVETNMALNPDSLDGSDQFDPEDVEHREGNEEYPSDTASTKSVEEFAKLTKGGEFIKSTPTVYYDFDSYALRPEAKEDLDGILEMLQQKPGVRLQIVSHTDARGPKSYNIILSNQRAQRVMEYLVENGADSDKLEAKGMGETQLTNECSDGVWCSPEQHAVNRRTDFVFTLD